MKSAVAGSSLAATAERPAWSRPSCAGRTPSFINDRWWAVMRSFRADLIKLGITPARLSVSELGR